MPTVEVRFFCESDGAAPALRWLEDLADRDLRAYLKCREVLGRLAQFGYELRRPTADLLESGIMNCEPASDAEISACSISSTADTPPCWCPVSPRKASFPRSN